MQLLIPAHLSHRGEAYLRPVAVDACIAPIVKALNDHNMITDASCCGHGKQNGVIALADGRQIEIYANLETWQKYHPDISGQTICGEVIPGRKPDIPEGKCRKES